MDLLYDKVIEQWPKTPCFCHQIYLKQTKIKERLLLLFNLVMIFFYISGLGLLDVGLDQS